MADGTRLIVKGLPKHLTQERLRDHFSSRGQVTDAKIMFTKDGKSRQFGFVGFKSAEEAAAAAKYFNRTYIDTSRIIVQPAKRVGDDSLPRPWSRYSEGSSLHSKANSSRGAGGDADGTDAAASGSSGRKRVKYKKKSKLKKLLKLLPPELSVPDIEADPQLAEFLAVMQRRGTVATWANDDVLSTAVSAQAAGPAGGRASAKQSGESQQSDDGAADGGKSANKRKRADSATADDASANSDGDAAAKRRRLDDDDEDVGSTGRLFVRNLPYTATEDEVQAVFSPYGEVAELHIPLDPATNSSKGTAFVAYVFPEHAVKAANALDGSIFQGRLLHILPAAEDAFNAAAAAAASSDPGGPVSAFQRKKAEKEKAEATSAHNWNSLFMRADTVAEAMADRLGVDKADVLDPTASDLGVKLALGETQIIDETKRWLADEGVNVEAFKFRDTGAKRSRTTILVKNLPYETAAEDLRDLFGRHGALARVLLPPTKALALVEFVHSNHAKKAFRRLAYSQFNGVMLKLEMAPGTVFDPSAATTATTTTSTGTATSELLLESAGGEGTGAAAARAAGGAAEAAAPTPSCVLYVKNINFDTTEETLREVFSAIGPVASVTHARKRDKKRDNALLSLGYGFVEFTNAEDARKALTKLQSVEVDGHALKLKFSQKKAGAAAGGSSATAAAASASKASAAALSAEAPSDSATKLVVRNVPFEATRKDIRTLFGTVAQVKSVRLPKKFDGTHRGFAFVDFLTHNEAVEAKAALASTHLLGRHLVIEWASEDDDNLDALRSKTADFYSKQQSASGKKSKKISLDV